MKESEGFIESHLIEKINPQPEVRKNAEKAKDWEFAEEAIYLYRMATLFKDRFLDPVLRTDRNRLPDPVISFDNLRNQNTLAAYTLVRNPQGLLYEITMNSQQYITEEEDGKKVLKWQYGKWAQLETLLHEQVHLWQQNFGEHPVKVGKPYHNKEFVEKCEILGLHPKLGPGYHTKLADGLFDKLMNEMGISPPKMKSDHKEFSIDWFKWYLDSLGKRRKGTSTLKKWSCPVCGFNVRIGIKGDPQLRHDPCEQKTGHEVFFVRADGLKHTIYEGDKSE